MSDHGRDKVVDCLFSGQDAKLMNVKFFRGFRDVISPEEFRAEFHSAIMQKRTKAATASGNAPRSVQPVVDVRALVADM